MSTDSPGPTAESCFRTPGMNSQMCHHVLNQNTTLHPFCFYPFVSHFYLIKQVCFLFYYSVCLVLRIWVKKTVWWRLKNLLCASSPKQSVPWERCSGSSCTEKYSLPSCRGSAGHLLLPKSTFQKVQMWAFPGSDQQYTTQLPTHPKPQTHAVIPVCKSARESQSTATPRGELSSLDKADTSSVFRTLGNTLNICRMTTLRLAEPCCICRENNEMHE